MECVEKAGHRARNLARIVRHFRRPARPADAPQPGLREDARDATIPSSRGHGLDQLEGIRDAEDAREVGGERAVVPSAAASEATTGAIERYARNQDQIVRTRRHRSARRRGLERTEAPLDERLRLPHGCEFEPCGGGRAGQEDRAAGCEDGAQQRLGGNLVGKRRIESDAIGARELRRRRDEAQNRCASCLSRLGIEASPSYADRRPQARLRLLDRRGIRQTTQTCDLGGRPRFVRSAGERDPPPRLRCGAPSSR